MVALDAEMDVQLVIMHEKIEQQLRALVTRPGEGSIDRIWARALEDIGSYTLRPSKRIRPILLALAYMLVSGARTAPDGLWQFAAATELLHAFMLIHDDIADDADLRRGGPTMHKMLGPSRFDADRAVVLGDYLFSLSVETMLKTEFPQSSAATHRLLSMCRYTGVGQFLDLSLSREPLSTVTVFRSSRVTLLKTALYGFSAPMTCGAMLADGGPEVVDAFQAAGCHFGRVYQLTDDLIGLFGDAQISGKSSMSDLAEGRRTFPVVVAYRKAPPAVQREMEELWRPGPKDDAMLQRARQLVEDHGGRAATERMIRRGTNRGTQFLRRVPESDGIRDIFEDLFQSLVGRAA